MNAKSLKIGIVGIGNMGTAHARNIMEGKIDGLKLAAVADIKESRRNVIPDLPAFASAEEMFESVEMDAVLIATPHYSHYPIAALAFQKGLHVLTEKPISVHKADCLRLIQAYQARPQKEQVFAAMFNQRTDPIYQKLKGMIDGGELGELHRIIWVITDWFRTYTYYSSGEWRATWGGEGGGVLLNQCPHQLDLWQWLFGMPEKLRGFCEIARFHDIEVEDDVTAYMEYANGCKGIFTTTTGETPGSNRLEISAEKGKVVIDGMELVFIRNKVPATEFSKASKSGFAKPETEEFRYVFSDHGPQHNGILQNFTNHILDGEELISPAIEGINSVELGNVMMFSSFQEKTLDFPIDADAYETKLQELIANSRFVKKTIEGTVTPEDFNSSF